MEHGLFRPVGRAGLVDAAAASIAACPAEQRRAVVDAVGVCGAWAGRAEGLDARILADLEQQLPPSMKPFLASTPEYMPPGTARWARGLAGDLSKVVFTHNQRDQGGVPGDRSIGRCETQGMRLARRGSCD